MFLAPAEAMQSTAAISTTHGATAVILNANAKRVSPRVRQQVRERFPSSSLYFTSSLDEARRATREILDRGYREVVAGGGDGTISLLVDTMLRETSGDADAIPRVRVLRLGTGNALATHVGAGSVSRELARLGRQETEHVESALPLNLIEAGGRLSFFAGCGLDAMICNDYSVFKRRARRHLARLGPLSRLCEGLPAYLAATFGYTLPRLLMGGSLPRVRVINMGRVGYRLDPSGKVVGSPYGAGDVLYEGPCIAASAGTLPFYGARMRMFPWACDRSGFMQVRVGHPAVPHVVAHLGQLWRGSFQHPRLHDFHATHVRLEFDQDAPFHVAGDAEGWHRELELKVSEHVVPMVHVN